MKTETDRIMISPCETKTNRQGRLTAELTSPTIKCNTMKYNKITRHTLNRWDRPSRKICRTDKFWVCAWMYRCYWWCERAVAGRSTPWGPPRWRRALQTSSVSLGLVGTCVFVLLCLSAWLREKCRVGNLIFVCWLFSHRQRSWYLVHVVKFHQSALIAGSSSGRFEAPATQAGVLQCVYLGLDSLPISRKFSLCRCMSIKSGSLWTRKHWVWPALYWS